MRLNDDKLDLSRDLFNELVLKECPAVFKTAAENIIRMLNVGVMYADYKTVSDLDRLLTVDYWREFDALPKKLDIEEFREWYLKATTPDLISRARRWLVENRYLILPTAISERAQEAAGHFGRSVKGK